MKQIDEMNKEEKEVAIKRLKDCGWSPCSIGSTGLRGWSKEGVTIETKNLWFDEPLVVKKPYIIFICPYCKEQLAEEVMGQKCTKCGLWTYTHECAKKVLDYA